jgi:hypothetical protein
MVYPSSLLLGLRRTTASVEAAHDWYRNFDLAAERERGLDDAEDHLHAVTFRASLSMSQTLTIVARVEVSTNVDGETAYRARKSRQRAFLENWNNANQEIAAEAPAWISGSSFWRLINLW